MTRFIRGSACLCVFSFISCVTNKNSVAMEMEAYELYKAETYNSTYTIYVNYDFAYYLYIEDYYVERGKFVEVDDTLFFFPKFVVYDDTTKKYDCFWSGYWDEIENANIYCIHKFVFLKKNKMLNDITLDYYFPKTESKESVRCEIPLEKVNVLTKQKFYKYIP